MSHDADPNAANAPDAPPAAGKDDKSNLPVGEKDDEARTLDNIDTHIQTDMIRM
jgi:hypothetical protein